MFIQTEDTPNPSTLKFLPGRAVIPSGSVEYRDAYSAQTSPLAEALFAVDGVTSVLLAHDFLSVTKADDKSWVALKPALLATIMDYFTSNPVQQQVVVDKSSHHALPTPANDHDRAVIAQICDLLDSKIRPAVAQDGGDVAFHSYDNGVVYVTLHGACVGCPSSTATLKAGVENMLRHYIPDVREVRRAS